MATGQCVVHWLYPPPRGGWCAARGGVRVIARRPGGPARGGGAIDRDPAWQRAWADAVVAAATRDAGEDARHRAAMKAWAREEFRWEKIAGQWAGYFDGAGDGDDAEKTE